MRPGLHPADVLLLMGFMWRVADDAHGKEQTRRLMDIAIDGFRPCPQG